jgi:hypothetical protein
MSRWQHAFCVNEAPLDAAITHTGRSVIRLVLRLLLTIVMGGAVLAIMYSCNRATNSRRWPND